MRPQSTFSVSGKVMQKIYIQDARNDFSKRKCGPSFTNWTQNPTHMSGRV